MNLLMPHFKKTTIALLFSPLLCFSQAVYTEAELIENNIKVVNITAREFVNDNVVKEVKVKNVVNEYGKSIEFTTYNPDGTIKSLIKSYYKDEGRTKIDTTFKEDGTIRYYRVSAKSLKGNTISNYQISPPNDTVVTQTRYLNRAGKDSLLITTLESKSFVSLKLEYNEDGILEKTTNYLPNGRIGSIKKTKYENGDECKVVTNDKGLILERTCFTNGEELTRFYYERNGYLYGIKMPRKNLGKRVLKRDENGLVKSVSHFDRKENMLSEIVYNYNI